MEKSNNYEQYKACLTLVMSQTNYNKDEAIEKLKKWDNDFIKVIKEYLNPNFQKKKEKKIISLNQSIMSELRKFKDKQCSNYIKEKNNEYEINKLIYLKELEKEATQEKQSTNQATQEKQSTNEKININIS
jgi:hypothetical protein